MNGANRSRKGTSALRHRCPKCKKLRKFEEPDTSQGGELHPRRPPWIKVNGIWVCGWCHMKALGIDTHRWWERVKITDFYGKNT